MSKSKTVTIETSDIYGDRIYMHTDTGKGFPVPTDVYFASFTSEDDVIGHEITVTVDADYRVIGLAFAHCVGAR